MEKLCLWCTEFHFISGGEHWSEDTPDTPGYNARMECWRDIAQFDLYNMELEDYREELLTAETCRYFKHFKEGDE